MPVLNTNSIDAVKVGSTNIDAIYKAGVKIWPAQVPGLLAEYRFAYGNELSDTSGNGRTAIASGDPFSLDSYAYSTKTSSSITGSLQAWPGIQMGEFTVEGWIAPRTPTASPIETGGLLYASGSYEGVGLQYSGNVIWCLVVETDGTEQNSGNVSIPVGTAGETSGVRNDPYEWIHVAVTVKGDAVNLWVGGQLSQSLTRTKTTPITVATLQIFNSTNGPGTFAVAGCRLWDSEKYTANFTPDTGLLNP